MLILQKTSLALLLSILTACSLSDKQSRVYDSSENASTPKDTIIFEAASDCVKHPFLPSYFRCKAKQQSLPVSMPSDSSFYALKKAPFLFHMRYLFPCTADDKPTISQINIAGHNIDIATDHGGELKTIDTPYPLGSGDIKVNITYHEQTLLKEDCKLTVLAAYVAADTPFLKLLADGLVQRLQLFSTILAQVKDAAAHKDQQLVLAQASNTVSSFYAEDRLKCKSLYDEAKSLLQNSAGRPVSPRLHEIVGGDASILDNLDRDQICLTGITDDSVYQKYCANDEPFHLGGEIKVYANHLRSAGCLAYALKESSLERSCESDPPTTDCSDSLQSATTQLEKEISSEKANSSSLIQFLSAESARIENIKGSSDLELQAIISSLGGI